MESIKLFVDTVTDVGSIKKINQDNILVKIGSIGVADFGLFIVCDGIGGLSKGEYASLICVNELLSWWDNKILYVLREESENEVIKKLNKILYDINWKIKSYGEIEKIRLGTTISLLLIKERKYYIANIGDSRIYKSDSNLYRLTEDHSLVNLMIKKGELTLDGAKSFKKKNIITQCLGVNDKVEIFNEKGNISDNDTFLLATDGFYNKIENHEINKLLLDFGRNKKNSLLGKYVDMVKYRGERDNISAIVVNCSNIKEKSNKSLMDYLGFTKV